jgi:hypothetical protein
MEEIRAGLRAKAAVEGREALQRYARSSSRCHQGVNDGLRSA